MLSVRRALLFSIGERYLSMCVALGTSVVIARLLTPEQIGVFSVTLAFIGVAQALRDFGIGNFLIQEKNLDEAKIRTAFGISLIIGTTMFVAALVAAPWVADFYGDPRLLTTIRIAAANFILLPFNTISTALLRRAMQFQRLMLVTSASSVLAAAASLGLAFAGFGENSLAAGNVVGTLASAVGAWLARKERTVLMPSLAEWRAVVRFGGQSSLAGVVTSVATDANDLIVGKALDFHAVGILSRAQGLMSLFHRDFMSAIRSVAFPALAAAHRQGLAMGVPMLRAVSLVVVFAWPFYGLVAIYAREIILLMYGSQWTDSVPLVPIYCAAGAVMALYVLVPNLLIAVGRIDLSTRMDLIIQPARVVLIAIAAWLFRSLEACALAFLLSALVSLPVAWRFKRQCVPDPAGETTRIAVSTALVVAATLLPAVLHATYAGWNRGEAIVFWQWFPMMGVCAGSGLWMAFKARHPLADEPWLRQGVARCGRLLGLARGTTAE